MTSCDHRTPTGLRTIEIRVPGANCPWCFNEAMDRVRRLGGVTEVRASILGECIEVEHHDVPTKLLVDTLRTYLHGTEDSSQSARWCRSNPRRSRRRADVPDLRPSTTTARALHRFAAF